MFDLGWQELLIILLIAVLIVGPKDLPRVVRTAGQWMGKARAYARDFQRTIEEAADVTEIDAVRKEIEEANKELASARRDVTASTEETVREVNEELEMAERGVKPASAGAVSPAPTAAANPASPSASNGTGGPIEPPQAPASDNAPSGGTGTQAATGSEEEPKTPPNQPASA